MRLSLDPADRKILSALKDNARLSVAEIARRVGLSKTPVAARIRALEETGLITGYTAILSPGKLGLNHVTYVQVSLSDTREKALREFNTAIRQITEVEECYMIAGNFDYLVKVRCQDIQGFRQVLGETISGLPHVASTSSFMAMEAIVESAAVSLE